MPEGIRFSSELPRWVRLAISEVVVLFGRIEQECIEISRLLKDANLAAKLKLAREPAKQNFLDIISAVERQEPGLKLDWLRNGFSTLADERNLIVHGAWVMAGDKPWVVWHKFLQDDDNVVGEFFEAPRFKRFADKGWEILTMLRKFHDMLEAGTGKKTRAVPRT